MKLSMRVSSMLFSGLVIAGGLAAQTAAPSNPPPQPLPVPWKCPGNIATNGGFDSNTVIIGDGSMPPSHTDAWTAAYGTPQLQGGAGCHDPDYVSFWGNQAVGEAIKEQVNFLAGHTYSFEFCARFHPEVGKLSSVNIVLRASSTPLTNTQCPTGTCEPITTTASITSTAWGTYTACWTAQRNESWLTISPSNGSNVNDGSQVSWGQVDDICIREVQAPVIDGPKDTCTSPATYCVKAPATGPFAWAVNSGTFQPANADGSCILVTWNQPNNGGAVSVTSNVLGCKVTSVVKPHECNHPPCCKDALKASLVDSEMVSGGEHLTVALSGPSAAMTVQATVLGASHVFQPTSCGVAGPIVATASSTQPPPPAGWNAPSVPFLNGNQIVWQSIPSGGSPLGPAPFQLNLQLPPTGSIKCNDVVTVCIEFEVTFAATKDVPCRTCKIVRCFTFTRCPMCQ